MRRFLRPIWQRRHVIVHSTKSVSGWVATQLAHLPLPDYLKQAAKDASMLSVQHLIIHSDMYQRWQRERAGTSRIQQAMHNFDANTEYDINVSAPTDDQWAALSGVISDEAVNVDVIIPVYRDYDQTLNAIYCAAKTREANETPYNILVIDDASPEPALSKALKEVAERGIIELLVNNENLGFVRTVNRGMAHNKDRDVILLNSDTEVYHNWIDRIIRCAAGDKKISTVTPLSNNAEICSYPFFVQDNPMPLECDYDALDALIASINDGGSVDAPTGVGFCMFISRHSLDTLGMFDAETFGKGYGEENEFCMRGLKQGFRHVIAADTFVRHIGGTSFGSEKKKLTSRAYDALCRLHPDYGAHVHKFIGEDALLPYRRAIDIARVTSDSKDSPCVMMVNHQMGGGTAKQAKELCAALEKESVNSIIIEPAPQGEGMLCIRHHRINYLPNLSFSMEYDRGVLLETLRALNVTHMHVHHLVNFPQRTMLFLQQICDALDIRYDVTLHDYYMICPRINLTDYTQRYCGVPAVTQCERCLHTMPSHAGGMPMWQWRQQHQDYLTNARRVFVPSQDVYDRIHPLYQLDQLAVTPHQDAWSHGMDLSSVLVQGETLRIAVIGAIAQIKGSDVLVALLDDAAARGINVEYTLIGHTDHPKLNAGKKKLTITGEYEESHLPALLEKHAPHVIFIPSIVPETYCFALSIAWRYRIMPVVFDIGAPPARIRKLGECEAGYILDYTLVDQPEAINDWFAAFDGRTVTQAIPDDVHYSSVLRDYYQMDASMRTLKNAA